MMSVGAIIDVIRTPAGSVPNPPGFRSLSPSMLLSMIPVPGTTTPDPDPLDDERLAIPPSASIALTWVVPVGFLDGGSPDVSCPDSAAQKRSRKSSSDKLALNSGPRMAFAAASARASPT